MLSAMPGGALARMTVFALGIMPYISASIILQLLGVVFEPVERLSKEGEQGRKTITKWTRYGTIVLSIVQGTGIAVGLQSIDHRSSACRVSPGIGFILLAVLPLLPVALLCVGP